MYSYSNKVFFIWAEFLINKNDFSEVWLIQTPLYFIVPRGLTYPDNTVIQCPQRSDLSRQHCTSVSPEVWLIQTTLHFSVPGGLTYPDSTVFQCPQRSDLSRLRCTSVSPEVWLIQTTLCFSVPWGLTYPDYYPPVIDVLDLTQRSTQPLFQQPLSKWCHSVVDPLQQSPLWAPSNTDDIQVHQSGPIKHLAQVHNTSQWTCGQIHAILL